MKPLYAAVWLATLAAAFGAGRYLASGPDESDPTTIEAFRAALDESDLIQRAYNTSAFMNGLGPHNIEAAVEVIEARRRWMSQAEMHQFMTAWTRVDPTGALERVMSWPSRIRNRSVSAVIYAWTLHDPAGGRAALDSIDDTELKEMLIDRMVSAWARSGDYAGVTEYGSSMPHGSGRGRLVSTLAGRILAGGPDALIAWAESIPESIPEGAPDGFKGTVIRKTSGVLAQENPLRAAAWIEGREDQPYAGEGVRIVAREWATDDPTAAMKWAMELPKKQMGKSAALAAFSRWFREKPDDAEAWLMAAEPNPILDDAHRILERSGRSKILNEPAAKDAKE
jgi:hypothetical protein